MNFYESGSIVWVKLSQHWWPGSVKSLDECPLDYVNDLKKEPLAIVKFFKEPGFHHVTKQEQVFSYNCNRKIDFIKKGLNGMKSAELCTKFEDDVTMAEKLTGGNMDLIKEIKENQNLSKKSKRIDYSNLGFGEPKPAKKTKDENHQKKGFSNIGEAIRYKPDCNNMNQTRRAIEHVVKILEQPKMDIIESTNFFKCYTCGFTCSRLNVIVWHNKNHLKTVADFDSGIKVPYRKKRKSKGVKSTPKKLKTSKVTPQTNGHASPTKDLHETNQLLLDWDDDEEEVGINGVEATNGVEGESPVTNGIAEEMDDEESDSDGYDDNYPPPQPKRERQPMPRQVDINSAFDALLGDSSSLNSFSNNHNNSSYVNNDSDSDGSWEKYYDKNSDSETEEKESDIRDICEDQKLSNGIESKDLNKTEETEKAEQKTTNLTDSSSPANKAKEPSSSSSTNPSPVPPKCPSDETPEDHSNQSSSSNSSTSSGPAYMLVAVDAHGNNVPMPVLSEGGNHLVAVEASMEDGTTRTLYIDPAHLGPNVDLNNLMLHIDNSGQETVIIPTSTADGEIISSTLVDQSSQDKDSSSHSSTAEGTKRSCKSGDSSSAKRKHLKDGELSTPSKTIEMKVSKLKKSFKATKEKSEEAKDATKTSKEEDPSSQEDELPDLEMGQYEGQIMFVPDEIVWALTHGNWWPSFVVKIYHKEKKASILFINCQQSTPIKVGITRMKAFNYADFPDMFESQKDKAVGLAEAMRMAKEYKSLRESDAIKETPKEFFSLPISEQQELIKKLNRLKRGIQIDEEPVDFMKMGAQISQSNKGLSNPANKSDSDSDDPEKSPRNLNLHDRQTKISFPEESTEVNLENVLSGREKQKLESAQKARRTENEKYIRFIQSPACLQHLRKICRTEIKSKRHDDFLFFSHQLHYWNDMNKRHNPGVDFFGHEESSQLEQMYAFLDSQFKENDLLFLSDNPKRAMYIKLVLFPESIKEALRHLTKLEEKKLETTLANGIFQTATEKKAKRLEYE